MKSLFPSNKVFFIFIALWLLLCTTIRQMSVPDEGRYGDISRWMYESGDWLVPRLNGLPFLHKPPLLHWLTSGLLEVFGVHVWVLRVVPAMAGFITLLAIFWFIKKHVNESLARTSVMVLLGSLLFFGSAEYVNHDLLVATGMSVTIFALADFVLTNNRRSLFIGYIACALAFLSKGLIGILLPGFVLLPWIIATGQYKRILPTLNPIAIVLFAAIALPWVVLVQQKYPQFVHYFFIEQQFDRFNSSGFNNKQPWYFYIAILLGSFLFWLVYLRAKWSWQQTKTTLGPQLHWLMVWWSIAMIVFFSIPQSKLAGYILPAVPPLAILLATGIEQIKQNPLLAKQRAWWSLVIPGLVGIALMLCPTYAKHIRDITPDEVNFMIGLGGAMLMACAVLAVLLHKDKLNGVQFTFSTVSLTCLIALITANQVYHKNNVGQTGFVSELGPNRTLVYDHAFFYDVAYLLDTKKPISLVGEWDRQLSDSTAQQLQDSLRFEPQHAQYYWSTVQLGQHIQSGQPLAVFTRKGAPLSAPASHEKVLHYLNYDVHLIN